MAASNPDQLKRHIFIQKKNPSSPPVCKPYSFGKNHTFSHIHYFSTTTEKSPCWFGRLWWGSGIYKPQIDLQFLSSSLRRLFYTEAGN